MALSPVPVDAAAVGNYNAYFEDNIAQAAPGFAYQGAFYEVLQVQNQFGDGFNYARVFRNNVELDASNAPKGRILTSVFDGAHTVVTAITGGAIASSIGLQNFDLSTGLWGPQYGTVGAPVNIGDLTEVLLHGADVIVLSNAQFPPGLFSNAYSGGVWTQTTLTLVFGLRRTQSCLVPQGILSYLGQDGTDNYLTILAYDYVTVTGFTFPVATANSGSFLGNMLYLAPYGIAILGSSVAANPAMASFVAIDPATQAVTAFLGTPCGVGAGGFSGIDPYVGLDNGVTLLGPFSLPTFAFDGKTLVGTYWCVDLLTAAVILRICWTVGNPLDVAGWTSAPGRKLTDGTNGYYLSSDYAGWNPFGPYAAFAAPSGVIGSYFISVASFDPSFTFELEYSMGLFGVPTLIDVQIVFRGVKRYQSGTVCEPLKELQDLPHVKKAV